ncbi:MAG: HAD family hydrolase [Verrucomicrobiota bacterium]|nr:HAD family hydrolase [Verrucomicrobiota bacterium]
MTESTLHRPSIVACVWDFDKTLIPGYMQAPLFEHYEMDEKNFWNEVNALPAIYRARGMNVATDTIYLNHLLSYIRAGKMPRLNNALLRKLGQELRFYPGLPGFFQELKDLVRTNTEYKRHNLTLEHYIISTGLAEMARGSAIAPYCENIYGCEFIEDPLPPYFGSQPEFAIETEREIAQVGMMVDNTIKTRFIFEINKGTNKIPGIDVNSKIDPEDRRIPIKNMLYIADGPSDIPVFSIVRKNGGQCLAVHDPDSQKEFEQNDMLQQTGRVNSYGPADYTPRSTTYKWISLQVQKICDRIVSEHEHALQLRVTRPPRHLHKDQPEKAGPKQESLFAEK